MTHRICSQGLNRDTLERDAIMNVSGPNAQELFERFSSGNATAVAGSLRNPCSERLKQLAEEIMRQWRARFPGIKTALGGSLGADIMGTTSYDLDLRILLPAGMDDEKDFKRISDALADEVLFDWRRDDLEHYTLIYHHSTARDIEGIPEPVYITLNIVRESEYYGLAELNRKMPQPCRDRYLVAKHKAAEAGDEADYEAVKRHWGDMITKLRNAGYFNLVETGRSAMLAQLAQQYPLFLSDYLEDTPLFAKSVNEGRRDPALGRHRDPASQPVEAARNSSP